jgi:hypothetical protein
MALKDMLLCKLYYSKMLTKYKKKPSFMITGSNETKLSSNIDLGCYFHFQLVCESNVQEIACRQLYVRTKNMYSEQ